jgi:endogenous inhibitor of DNA gyrase (YacG/DUF329 family)
MTGLLCLNWFHVQLGEWTKGEIYVPVLQTITYPYTALVVVVGGFIWTIPRHRGERCGTCGYSLDGLEAVGMAVTCPECGTRHAVHGSYRRSGTDRQSFETDDDLANTHERFATARTPRARSAEASPTVVRLGPTGPVATNASTPQDAPEPADREDGEGQAADQRPAERAEAAR